MDPEEITRAAQEELRQEAYREAVNREIVRQRKRMATPWWLRLIPIIKIEWRD